MASPPAKKRSFMRCAALLLVLACGKQPEAPDAGEAKVAPPEAAAPAVEAEPAVKAEPALHHGLPWYADGADAAFAAAHGTDNLVLVDLWA